MDTMTTDWIAGDLTGMAMPAHPDALREGGAVFLTEAFRRSGAIALDNAVAEIVAFEDCPRGSTGRKVLLSVAYEKPDPALHTRLFVKFSRAFDDPLRDNQRYEMEDEARFAAVSSAPGFPIDVPRCYFSDFHHASGTGVIITQRVPYGGGRNEPHYEKCMDWAMPAPLEHYRAIVAANGRLAGAHRAGALPADIERFFPFDREAALAANPIRYDATKLSNRIARYADFAARFPQLLPANLRSEAFLARLRTEMPRFLEHEHRIKRWLFSDTDQIVFAHWNANVDNAWFWRDVAEALHCGFIDWGRVGQMNVAQALWGTLSGAELSIWDDHLDELLAVYVAAFRAVGGGDALAPAEIRLQMDMLIALLGICWLLDAVPLILREIPDLETAPDRFDPRFQGNELARNQLHMLSVFLNLWDTHRMGDRLDEVLARTA